MRSNTFLGLTAALALFGAPVLAQQGEGSGGDYVMTTAVNGGAADTADKSLQAFDVLTVNLSSPGGSCSLQPFILAGRIAPSSANFQHPFTPQIGLDPADAFIIIDTLNSPYPFNPLIPPAGGVLSFNFAVPCDAIWNTPADNGVWLQSAGITPVAGPTTIFGIYELSETIKHDVVDSLYPCQWYDTCSDALQAPGLSDADLGVTFILDTNLATNDFDTTGLSGFTTQTTFNVVAPGSGSGSSSGTAKDWIAKFTATAGGSYTFDMCASTYDSRIWLMPATCALPVAGIAHNDDASADAGGACVAPGHSLASRLRNICLAAGQQVLIVVDGFGSSNGVANLTITRAPLGVASITPNSASGNCPPATLTISGLSFVGPTVDFSGIPATIVSNTCSQIVVDTPTLATGVYDVNVTNADATTASLIGGYTSIATVISNVTPNSGASLCPPATITITGNGFLPPTAVDFSGNAATVVTETCTEIVVNTPGGLTAGAYDVNVVNADLTSASAIGGFTLSGAVSIASVSPACADVAVLPASITINGQNFDALATVTIGGLPAVVTTATCNQLVVTTPALASGDADVTVVNPDLSSATVTGAIVVGTRTNGAASDDSSVAVSMSGSFTFYGISYTSFRLCTNGRIQFGTTGNTDFSESLPEMMTQSPMINLFWDDCNASVSASPSGAHYAIDNATTVCVEFSNIRRYTLTDGFTNGRIILTKATGEIRMTYGAVNARGCITGVSPGSSLYAVTPPEINISATASFTAASALDPVYEQFTGPSADPCDLTGRSFGFTPTGGVGIGPYMFHNP